MKNAWWLAVLIAAWILPGLVGRDPWKADEAYTYGLVLHMSETGDLVVPELGGEPFMQKPTLFFATAAAFCKVFGGLAGFTTAAHGANVLFLGMTLLAVACASRELNGEGARAAAVVIFMGCVIYLHTAHLLMTDVSLVAGFAVAIYGMALVPRRKILAGLWLGTGAGIAFMSKGLLGPGLIGLSLMTLMVLFPAWRTRAQWSAIGIATLASMPWILIWPLALLLRDRELFDQWFLDNNLARFLGAARVGRVNTLGLDNSRYWFITALPWYTWPAFPLACLACWRERANVLKERSLQLPVVSTLVVAGFLTLSRNGRELYGLPMLVPISIVAGRGVRYMGTRWLEGWRKGSLALFGIPAAASWLVWLGIQLGWPAPLMRKLHDRFPDFEPSIQVFPLVVALLATAAWLWWMSKQERNAPLNALANWTSGPVLGYLLAMSVWLPLLEANMSYKHLASVRPFLPPSEVCVASVNLGEPQRAMFHYYAGLKTQRREIGRGNECHWLLIQSEARKIEPDKEPGPGWKLVWTSIHSRKELFRLFQRETTASLKPG